MNTKIKKYSDLGRHLVSNSIQLITKMEEVDLQEISKLPDKELKRHFREWLERDDIARTLQAKLRKDLFANFNKTSLGRKMFAQHVKSQGIILSPLILVLNTLIAEFLYTQKCHFSLSVFCTEVPYRNLLPDFENIENFRFKKTELFEIMEAINTKMPMELKKLICIQYFETKNENASISLLYILLKNIFEYIQNPDISKPEVTTNIEPTKTDEKGSMNGETKNNKKDKNSTLNNSNLRFLNRYLILLSKKVQEMSLHLEKLEQKDIKNCNKTLQEVRTKKYEHINRKLGKISENLNLLSTRKYKQTSSILNAIQQLAKQFEKCATNFLDITKNENNKEHKNYEDWINELKTSKSGRKFINKIESSLRKTLEAERERVAKEFTEKMENEKQLLKLKFKQKYAEQLNKALRPKNDKNHETPQTNENIDEKLKEFTQKHEQLLKRITNTEDLIKTATFERKELKDEVNQTEEVKNSLSKSPNSAKAQIIKDITPQLEGLAKSIAQQERNIDHIVFDAKLRIQELEYESIQLDRNFQDYLKRQKLDNKRTDENASTIWQNYNMEKERLNKKCAILRSQPQRNTNANLVQSSLYDNLLLQIPQIHLSTEPISNEHENDTTEISNFENPFRKLQNTLLLSKKSKKNSKNNLRYENSSNALSFQPNINNKINLFSENIDNIQLKSNLKSEEEFKLVLNNDPTEKIKTKLTKSVEIKTSPIRSPTDIDKENVVKANKVKENTQNDKGLSQFIISKTTKKLSPTSDNIFQLVKDEDVNRILESSESIKLDLSPRLPPYERSPSNMSNLSGNISFENNENKSPDTSFWN